MALKIRTRRAHQRECPPESYWDLEQRMLLSRADRAQIQDHCVRCEACRLREDRTGTHDGIPARVVAGLAATILLAGVIRWPVSRPAIDEAFIPTAAPAVTLVQSVEPASEIPPEPALEQEQAAPQQTVVDELPAPHHRRHVARPVTKAVAVTPNRTFVPPPHRTRRVESVRLDPPPMLAASRLETPHVPLGMPNLQPPRRSPIKKFVSALAIPFRHI